MYLIRRPFTKVEDTDTPDVRYSITKNDTGIIFAFETTYQGTFVKNQIVLDFDTYKGKIFQVSLQRTDQQAEIAVSPLYEMSSRYFAMREQANEAYVLARFSVAEDCEDIVIFLQHPTDYAPDGFDIIDFDESTETKFSVFQKYSPFFKERAERAHKKVTIMRTIDIYNNVAYLESQVDALTKLVMQLTEKYPDITKDLDTDAIKVLTEANNYNVLDIKSTDKMISEFETDKKLIRNLQTEYYAEG